MSEDTARWIIRELEHLKEAMCARELPQAGREFIDKRIGYYKNILDKWNYRTLKQSLRQ
jgi:hypothetical protein